MVNFITTAIAFIVALSILIAVHEFGHFWFARMLGVKVLRFSIGFGKPLWSVRRGPDQTEYAVAAIPLGGYVKMLDEREGEVAESEVHRAFNRQPVAKRFAIVMAGPLFNLIFAVFAMWLMLITGIPDLKSVVGDVAPGTPAAASGLQPRMEITAVGDAPTSTWSAVVEQLLPKALNKEPVELTVLDKGQTRTLRLPLDRIAGEVNAEALLPGIGMEPYQAPVPPVIGGAPAGSAAAKGGLMPGDRVIAVNGTAVHEWDDMVEVISVNPGKSVQMTVERDGRRLSFDLRPEPVDTPMGKVGQIGAHSVEISTPEWLLSEVRYGAGEAFTLAVERNWDMAVLTLRMLGRMVVGEASLKNISGPITIARYAKVTADAGLAQFLGFLAVVSLSLGVLNLLPIPVLDGGHLMFYVAEAVKGRPVSQQTELLAQKIGIVILLMLMAIAFYNDFARWLA